LNAQGGEFVDLADQDLGFRVQIMDIRGGEFVDPRQKKLMTIP
jgi:hypothetical protein